MRERKESDRKKKVFTLDERLRCLEVLKANRYDYDKTSAETGVCVTTLYTWNGKYRNEIEKNTNIQIVAKAEQARFQEYKLRFLSGHFNNLQRVADKAILRMEELLGESNSLRDVAKALETMYNYIEKLTDENTPPSNPTSNARTQINILNANTPPKVVDGEAVEI